MYEGCRKGGRERDREREREREREKDIRLLILFISYQLDITREVHQCL